jgi:hypothetical protein
VKWEKLIPKSGEIILVRIVVYGLLHGVISGEKCVGTRCHRG